MAPAAAGYFRRMARKLTEDIDQLDAEDMESESRASGAQRACDCARGDEVTMIGRLRSVEACSKSANAAVQAEFFDGTDTLSLVWMGRRKIAGIESGTQLLVRGRVGERDGRKVIYNPYYELRSGD
ncbi:OB-fold nucleic acid binding domain-containing protein [Rhodococcoides corynebacterioides]|uniref:OB-fold nucleic acid binding domain-containing protein n=1 Tax=Rhodococcoides corynebacterioides TaxID=53972 RepID=UPI003F7EAB73